MDELRLIWKEFVRNGDDKIKYSRCAFETLRRRTCFRFGAIMDFLQDSSLNVKGSGNLGEYFGHLAVAAPKFSIKMCNWDKFFDAVHHKILFGDLQDQELWQITKHLKGLLWRSWKTAGDIQTQKASLRAYKAVWHGLVSTGMPNLGSHQRENYLRLASEILLLPSESQFASSSKAQLVNDNQDLDEFKSSVIQELLKNDINLVDRMTRNEQKYFKFVCLDILARCPTWKTASLVPSMTKSLARHSLIPGLASESYQLLLNTWLECLRECKHMRATFLTTDSNWNSVYAILANNLPPDWLSNHFKHMDSTIICHILLRHWLPKYIPAIESRRAHMMQSVYADFEEHSRNWTVVSPGMTALIRPFVMLVYRWLARGLPTKKPLQIIVDLVQKIYGPEAVLILLRGIRYDQTTRKLERTWTAPTEMVIGSIYKLLESDPLRALQLFRHTQMNPENAQKVTLDLISKAGMTREDVHHLITSNEDMKPQPVSLSPATLQFLNYEPSASSRTIWLSRDDLLDCIAIEFALNPHRSSRAAFRDVCSIYQLLRAKKIPPRSGFAMALVHVGIIRPLEASQWVSTVKLQWILKIVSAVEGPGVADKVDRLAWLWRGTLLQHWAKQKRKKAIARKWR